MPGEGYAARSLVDIRDGPVPEFELDIGEQDRGAFLDEAFGGGLADAAGGRVDDSPCLS